MLFVMGAIYLVTIRLYLPVPHLEVFRLLPGGAKLSEGLRLGLTLPACVLPLLMIVGLLLILSGLYLLNAYFFIIPELAI
jgi:hypothetical protein